METAGDSIVCQTSQTVAMREHRRRRHPSGEDRISRLPADEVLHCILVHLRCARAAARTGVLSRRWQHVWAEQPEVLLHYDGTRRAASFVDAVDGALAACSAPTLDRLSISVSPNHPLRIPVSRVQPWLCFASEREVGALCMILVPRPWFCVVLRSYEGEAELTADAEKEVLDLPAWEGVTKIDLVIQGTWRLRPPSAGVFAALTSLKIKGGRMAGSDLAALVCTQCPRLRDLNLDLDARHDVVSLSSDSLHSLRLLLRNTRRLQVVAPRLEQVTVDETVQAHISAPKLAKLAWHGSVYDPRLHQLADVGRRLRLPEISIYYVAAPLIQQFDEVDELRLDFFLSEGRERHESSLNNGRVHNGINRLCKCKIIRITITLCSGYHAWFSDMMRLLRSCSSTRELSILFLHFPNRSVRNSCSVSSHCRLKENRKFDGVVLYSLEEVEISGFTYSQEKVEFLEFVFRNAPIVKKLVINYTEHHEPPLTKEVCEKIRSMCQPNVKVEFYVLTDGCGFVSTEY